MSEPEFFLISVLSVGIVIMALIAVLQKNLIRAIFAYSIASVSLSAIFFVLESPYAGAFELTVGAGLVTVLFLVALILSGGEEEEVPV